MSNVSIKLLREGAKLPTRGSAFAAGYDLYACLDGDKELIIPPHATAMLPTGLSFALPEGTVGAVVARSGLASKQGLRPANCLGVIDSDYRGECFVALHNDSNEERTVRHGDRVAQLVLLPFLPMESIHLILLNLIYDLSCTAIPWDNVDEEETLSPRDWSGRTLGRFMLSFGPISSLIDIVPFLFLYYMLCPMLCGGGT